MGRSSIAWRRVGYAAPHAGARLRGSPPRSSPRRRPTRATGRRRTCSRSSRCCQPTCPTTPTASSPRATSPAATSIARRCCGWRTWRACTPAALRAGHLDGAIAFAKGRALERLRAYDVAADAYRIAAEREPELAEEAKRSAALCDGLTEALAIGVDLKRDTRRDEAWLQLAAPTMVLGRFDLRAARLDALLAEAGNTHHAAIVREEIERSDVERARYFGELRHSLPDGDVQAVAELRRVTERHAASKNAPRHLLALADLYVDLATEYAEQYPPEGMFFDPSEFQDLVDSAARIYEMVAARDGTPERIEASRRLEAFLAFSIAIDRERFTP